MTASDLTADLPAPRDDEPASLRNDIADELRDHLECALRREELKTPTEPRGLSPWPNANGVSNAYQRVLQRFGNPRTVARKLWFDAMREKIMGQRIAIMLQAIMAGAVIAMCVIVYQSMQNNAHTQGMLVSVLNKTQQEPLQSQREANEQLIQRLAALAKRSEAGSGAPTEWNPLTVQCRFDTEDGPPAAGVKVVLTSESDNTAGIPTTEQLSDENGSIDFGKVLYGQYALTITAPNGMLRVQDVSVMPGRAKDVTIVCPRGDGLTSITPRIVPSASDPPPAELADQLWYFVRLQRRNNGFKTWQRYDNEKYIDWLIGPQGKVLDVTPLNPQPFWKDHDLPFQGDLWRASLPPNPLNMFISNELLITKPAAPGPLLAEPGMYIVALVSPCLLHPDTSQGMRLLLLTPPQRLSESQFGEFITGNNRREPHDEPTFTVIYDKPATVDIPLTNLRFAEFDRVLKAGPGLVAWRFTGNSSPELIQRRVMFMAGSSNPRARIDLPLFGGAASPVLTGIEVIARESIEPNASGDSRTPRGGFGRIPKFKVAAILLVTPEEGKLLARFQKLLEIGVDKTESPRTQLTPEIIQSLEQATEQSADAAVSNPDEPPPQDGDSKPATP